jgi:hypothetical protein
MVSTNVGPIIAFLKNKNNNRQLGFFFFLENHTNYQYHKRNLLLGG